MTPDIDRIRLPFREQIDFFRAKLNLPSERWDSIEKAAHDRAFIVAGAMDADLLNDLRGAVDAAIAGGDTLADFRSKFRGIVQQHGWHGWAGEGSAAGEAWRTKTIYATNVRTSHAAGRWAQLNHPDLLKARPFWRYVHNDSVAHPRPLHLAWNGLTLRHDHPFWKTHFAPNGWGCRCRIMAVRGPAEGDKTEPPDGWDTRNAKGDLPGIDQGWDYAPGANAATPLREMIDRKLIDLDAPIGAALWDNLKPALALETRLAMMDMADRVNGTMQANGESLMIHAIAPATLVDMSARGAAPQVAGVWLRDHELLHAIRDTKAGRGHALPVETWRDLPRLLETATPYLDSVDTALLYAFDLEGEAGKVLIRVNYTEKVKQGGARSRVTANFVRSGGVVEKVNIENDSRYVALKK